jgi:hypothetical protein
MWLDEVSAFITWFDFIEIHRDKLKYLVTVNFLKPPFPQKQIKEFDICYYTWHPNKNSEYLHNWISFSAPAFLSLSNKINILYT